MVGVSPDMSTFYMSLSYLELLPILLQLFLHIYCHKWIYSDSWGSPNLTLWAHWAYHNSNGGVQQFSEKNVTLKIVCTVEENPSSKSSRIHFRDLPLIFELFSLYCSFCIRSFQRIMFIPPPYGLGGLNQWNYSISQSHINRKVAADSLVLP